MYEESDFCVVGDRGRAIGPFATCLLAAAILAGCHAPPPHTTGWAAYLATQARPSESGALSLTLNSLRLETTLDFRKSDYERTLRLEGSVTHPSREPGVRVDPVLGIERIEDQSGRDLAPFLHERSPGQFDARRRGSADWPKVNSGGSQVQCLLENLPARAIGGLRVVEGYALVELPAATKRVELSVVEGEREAQLTDDASVVVELRDPTMNQIPLRIVLHETPKRDYRTQLYRVPLMYDFDALDDQGRSIGQARVTSSRIGREGLEYIAVVRLGRDRTIEDLSRLRTDWVTEADEVHLPFSLHNITLEGP
jgi:hypothetical protein